jgi:alpha-methylacyl-CoA racemase
MDTASPTRSLAGTVLLSVGHTLPGLYCLAMLRDLGARVIRIEPPTPKSGGGTYEGMDATFPIRSFITGTDSLHLDLKHGKGIETFRRLAQRTDVVLEGFRPGVMQRLGIDYDVLSEEHPELIYAAITGYGQTGRHRDRAGHDINYLAETGILALTNPVGLPGATFADGLAGASAALNIVAALHGRSRTGKGQMIDCAIVDGPMSLMTSEFEYYWNTGDCRGIGGTHLTGSHPWYAVHATRDGKAMAVGSVEPRCYEALCHGLGHPELAKDQFAKGASRQEAEEKIIANFAGRSREEVEAVFEEYDACVSPVRNTREVTESVLMDRAVRHDDVTGEAIVRTPVRLPAAEVAASKHGADVLAAFGFSAEDIGQLLQDGVTQPSE